jgi:hypothetical protein
MSGCRHPEVTVRLLGADGNSFSVLGRAERALRRAGVSDEEIKQFRDEATAKDYDKLPQTVTRYVEVE